MGERAFVSTARPHPRERVADRALYAVGRRAVRIDDRESDQRTQVTLGSVDSL
jgi:hypothetical protein